MNDDTFLPLMQTRVAPNLTREAFSQLYEESHLIVYRYIYSMYNGPKEDIEDLTAETFWRAWKARKRFSGSRSAAVGWLIKIAQRLVIDTYRKNKTRGFALNISDLSLAAPDISPEEKALYRENAAYLLAAMQELPIDQREVLILRYVLGWRVKDIGEHMGIPENTISVTIRRTLQKLKTTITQQMDIV